MTKALNQGREDDDLRSRKKRLSALKARHRELTAVLVPDPSEPRPEAQATKLMQILSGGPSPAGNLRRQMIGRMFRMLTEHPTDNSDGVPGTPFTRQGVERLMTFLAQKAGDSQTPGAKVAQNALRYMSAPEGEPGTVGGASLEKLQMLARQAQTYNLQGGQAGV